MDPTGRYGQRIRRVLMIGNYPPRQCGIATFTADLCEALVQAAPEVECQVVAMNDRGEGYAYPARVCFEIDQDNREHYDIGADFINLHRPDVVCLQHEYGIFGGRAGRYILSLLKQIHAPVVTTLHTILREPDADQAQVMRELIERSDRLVVMAQRGREFLQEIYGAPEEKVVFIPHGVPDLPFVDPNFYKDQFDAQGRLVLMTFGLINPGKGIETVIEALRQVVKRFPAVLYLVVGATHPHVRQRQGEEYRHHLARLVRQYGLGEHVRFVNRFVSAEELREYLGAADIYITPYINPAQITSGTLAYAVGAGKAVISTPYWYAQELLGEGRGRLFGFRQVEELAEILCELIGNEVERHAMRKRAYQFGRAMIWPQVGRQYLEVFEEVCQVLPRCRWRGGAAVMHSDRQEDLHDLPQLNARYLLMLTDETGILQHARYGVPDLRHGYSTDDQARALVVAVKAGRWAAEAADWTLLATRYLAFLLYAFDERTRRFRNFMDYQRQWKSEGATEEVHARAMWALAHVLSLGEQRSQNMLAAALFSQAMEPVLNFQSPRALAMIVLAIVVYLRKYPGATSFRRECEELAGRLLERFQKAEPDWPWPEERLTYANARLPQALIEAGQCLNQPIMVQEGLRILDWLDRLQTAEAGHFVPVGTNGWYPRGGQRARFDQQPIEAYTMLDACAAAYLVSRERRWLKAARRAFDWFLGANDLSLPVYDFSTGACHDGLHADRLNENRGAESLLCWLLSLLRMYELKEEIEARPVVGGLQERVCIDPRPAPP